MIELKNVTKEYKMGDEDLIALDNVSLSIKDGDFVSLMGPSGSGKSTLAHLISGLDKPTSGEIIVDEKNLSHLKDRELSKYRNKKFGFVFQNFNLQPGYTALENVEVPLLFSKIKSKVRKEMAKKALSAVGLGERLNHRPSQLSGGQRQRVAIARALVNSPRILIADEPTGNLDTKKGAEILKILLNLNMKTGITVIVITHDPAIASKTKRVLKIRDGRIVR